MLRQAIAKTKEYVGAKGIIGIAIFIYCAIPDWDARNGWWKLRVPFILHNARVILIFVALLVIWLDHRNILKKRTHQYDSKSLKGRTLKLRDEIQSFWDDAGPAPEIQYKSAMKPQQFLDANMPGFSRELRLAHGYELRFSEDVIRIYHAFGERGAQHPLLRDIIYGKIEKDDACLKTVVDALTELANRPEAKN